MSISLCRHKDYYYMYVQVLFGMLLSLQVTIMQNWKKDSIGSVERWV